MKANFAAWLLLGAASSVLGQPIKPVGTLTADVAEPGKAPMMTCQSLASVHLPGMKIMQASVVAPEHCVATANIKLGRGSNIKIELSMPTRDWNGKLVMIGIGASNGSTPRADMVDPLRRGYAVVSTDSATSGPGVHQTLVKAKAMTVAFYGAAPRYSYLTGSASGGSQGLKVVQMYPADFDGVVVGEPANDGADVGSDAPATDLSAFAARGGKIIQHVAAIHGGPAQTASFYRLFLIPVPEPANGTYSIDWLSTLEEWVERGRAPASVLANHIPPPNAVIKPPPPGAVVFEPAYGVRVMCAYPSVARLQAGLGEVPVDWICQPGP